MALTDAEIGEFLDHSSQMDIGDWYPGEILASATPSPHMGADLDHLDPDFGTGDWVAGGSALAATTMTTTTTAGHTWTHPTEPPHMAFDSGHGLDPQMHAAGYGGYYSQGQQQQQPVAVAQGYGYDNMLGVYQGQGAAPVAQVSYHQGTYDAGWQGGYSNTGSW